MESKNIAIMVNKIIALITVYYPNESVISNIQTIIKQVDFAYICDNSPSECYCLSKLENSKYLFNGKNLGLSLAFNKVFKEYDFKDDDFIIFFDQDSTITDGYISSIVSEYKKLELEFHKIGGLGPNFYNSFNLTKESEIHMHKNTCPAKVDSIMTSSFLCKYKILKEINFWNEEIFLDLADWDLCWRLKEKGYFCFITPAITLCHTLGNGEKKIGVLRIKEGSASRVYYQTRDCLRLITKSYVPFRYKIRFILMLTVRPIEHLIFLDKKKQRIGYFIKGIKDFVKGIYGSL